MGMHDIITFEYLDVGANDPVRGNDFWRAYLNGNSGICIDPLPYLSRRWKKRPRDYFINGALLFTESLTTDLYVHSEDRLSSLVPTSNPPVKVPVVHTSDFLSRLSGNPIVVKIDIEGGDVEIAKLLICLIPQITLLIVETFEGLSESNQEISDFEEFIAKDFKKCAFTPLNTFYFNRKIWKFNSS